MAVLEALDPQGMLVFAALSRAKGVRGAAAALGVPRSTVSRRLAALEEAVGAALVVRTNRRFSLTELGVAFAARCERLEELLRESDALVRDAAAEPSGKLRIDAAPVLGEEVLPFIVAELCRRYPRLSVEAKMSADYSDLRRGAVDVALRAWPIADATDLFAVRVGTSVTGCYLSPAYAAAHGVPEEPAALVAHECIVVGSANPPRWTFRRGGREERVQVSGRVRVDSFRLARALAVSGTGIVRLARVFAEPLVQTGELLPVLERYWPETPLNVVHAGPSPPPPKVRAFIELAREAVARMIS
jgi:DNA-binding transcriptional LysR family regulator